MKEKKSSDKIFHIINNQEQIEKLNFKFSDDQVSKFKDQNTSIEVGIDHKEYSHTTKFSEDNIKALSADFN